MKNSKQLAKQRILEIFDKEPQTPDELAYYVICMTEFRDPQYHLTGFAWNINYFESVSNSHHCPIDGVTNWRGDSKKPRGYPGYYGRVWIRLNTGMGGGAPNLSKSLTYTGTGGSGSYNAPWSRTTGHAMYSWDYRFYLRDWPMIAKWVDQQKLLGTIKGESLYQNHRFKWEIDDGWPDDVSLPEHMALA